MISSFNEWDTLRRIVVGDATHANWPVLDPVFRAEAEHTLWKETPLPAGPVPQWIIDETNQDLQTLADTLTAHGVEVLRPTPLNFQVHDGLYNYCPRDRLIVHGSTIINPAMMYPCRDMELQCYHDIVDQAEHYHFMPRNEGMVLDAANVLRLGPDKMLFLESASGNRAAYDWLCKTLPDVDIELCNFYAGVHIDSTIVALNADQFVVNGSRLDRNRKDLPRHLSHKEIFFVNEVVAQGFHEYPYASKWIGLNMLSIDPQTVIVDAKQEAMIQALEQGMGMTVIPLELRHSRTLGGGFHCVTLDLVRS
jgi:glycine amidinotransferase/scyllo-inosamine-4-phosphate amidinotransferase 1